MNVGKSKFSDTQLPQKYSMKSDQGYNLQIHTERCIGNKEINQINRAKEQITKEELTDQIESESVSQQTDSGIKRHHTFNERKRAFSSPHPFQQLMRDSINNKDQIIATPTFGDDDWKSTQLHNLKDKKEGTSACQTSPKSRKLEGYDIMSKHLMNNSSIIHTAKDQSSNNLNMQIMNNDSIGLHMKLANCSNNNNGQQAEKNKKSGDNELESYQFIDNSVNNSMINQTPQLCAIQNLNDVSSQSINQLDSSEAGINSSTALKHPKISKKSPLFEKFGQFPSSRQRSPDSSLLNNNNNINNSNLCAYNYPSMTKQNGSKYSNIIYTSSNNSTTSLQASQYNQSSQHLGIHSECELSDLTPQKKLSLNLYNQQLSQVKSVSDKKQIVHRSMNNHPSFINTFNLRNYSDANILANQTSQPYDINVKINSNNSSSFLPSIEKPQMSGMTQIIGHAQSTKHSNEIRMLERGFSEESSSILSYIQKSTNQQAGQLQLGKYPIKRINSVDDQQSISTCFTSIKASSPIKKNRIDIFNDFNTVSQQQRTQESDYINSQRNLRTYEDNSNLQMNLLQGDKLNFSNIQAAPKRILFPPNYNSDIQEDNFSTKNNQSQSKKSRELSQRHDSPQFNLEQLRKKNSSQPPQIISNTIGNLVQYTKKVDTIDYILNLQLDKIDLKKQNSSKRTSPSQEQQKFQNQNPLTSDITDHDIGKNYSSKPPTQINSYRSRKPNSIHVMTQEKQKRAESAKNKTKLNLFQNTLIKKDLYDRKVQPESARFVHQKRKLSIKQNEPIILTDRQKGKSITPQFVQQEQRPNNGNEIKNLYDPDTENANNATEKICNKIQGMFIKQKEIYEQKYKRKLTANKEENDLLKQLNTALEELKNVHTYQIQISSNRNDTNTPNKNNTNNNTSNKNNINASKPLTKQSND